MAKMLYFEHDSHIRRQIEAFNIRQSQKLIVIEDNPVPLSTLSADVVDNLAKYMVE